MAMTQKKTDMHAIQVERKAELRATELEELCIATEDAIRDGIGFNWLMPPERETLENYWNGVRVVPNRTLFVAKLDGVIVGSIQLVRPSKSKETTAFSAAMEGHFVAPWARGYGMAKMLLEHAEREAAKEGFSIITLSVRGTQDRALTLYRDHGYEEWGTMPFYEFVNAQMVAGHYFYKKLKPISNLI